MAPSSRGDSPRELPVLPTLSLVATLDPLLAALEDEPVLQLGRAAGAAPVIPMVRVLSEAVVLPQVFAKHRTRRPLVPPTSPTSLRLAKLLVDPDPRPAYALLRKLYAKAGSLSPLCATILEPAARGLGDLWLADACSQLQVTTALCRMQTIVGHLTAEAAQVTFGLPAVLVVPQPGEGHLLGASLDAELLWQAGWDTHREFPESDDALQQILSEGWFDVLDLSLSPTMQREDWLSRMAETIARARAASKNPALAVVATGRAFFEHYEACATVGADASTTSSLQIVLTVSSALRATSGKTVKRSPAVA